ncbi:MAG: hypothetical protein IKI11_00970 [Neisseriaceae bacterium]|nr:hypothetical protein [Neisseriaceae bacterium]
MKYLKTFFSAFLNFVIFIVFLCIIPICFVPYVIGEETFWGTMGDYIGGIIGTIAALLVLMATREIINLQKQELKETRAEFKKQSAIFNQQQFEETFFSLIKLLGEKQPEQTGKNNNNQDYRFVYGLIKELIEIIENYRKECIKEDMPEEEKKPFENEIKHYINILKLQVKDETHLYLLNRIMDYTEIELKEYFKQNHFCEFIDMKIVTKDIEKYFGEDIFGNNQDWLRMKSEDTDLEKEDYQELYKPDGENITTDIVILKHLSKNIAPKMPENILVELAQNHQQEELTEEDKKEIRQNVAKNQNAPETILEILSKYSEDNIREAVAANQNTPEWVLNKLATDECIYVREAVAKNPKTTTDILDKLSEDGDYCVRLEVAKNKNTSSNTLQNLAKKYEGYELCLALVKHKNTLPETLHNLSQNEDDEVRLEIAKDKRTLPETLTDLSKDKKHKIRLEVAKNNHTPQNTLADLANAENSSENIKIEVAKNTNTSEQTLLELSKMQGRYYYFVIINPVTTSKMLEELYNSILEEEKHIYLLENEKTPLHIMENILKKQWVIYKNSHNMDHLINLIKNNKLLINSKNNIVLNIIKEIIKKDDWENIDYIHPIIQQFNQENKEKLITFIKEEIKKDNISVYNALLRLIVDSDNLFSEQDFIDMEKDILKHENEKDYDTKRKQLSNMIERKKLQS